jgi:hypothetical protein
VVEGRASPAFADRLERTTRQTRKASRRSWLALIILVAVGAGAVAAGLVAENEKFWTFAGIVFATAMTGVVAYAANQLGVAATMTDMLRATLKVDGDKTEKKDSAQRDTHLDKAAEASTKQEGPVLRLARSLENDGLLVEAEHAYLMAAEETDDPDALSWLGELRLREHNYEDAAKWLNRAKSQGNVEAAYRLGRLEADPDDSTESEIPAELDEAPRWGPLKLLAETMPNRPEFWQAYLSVVQSDEGTQSARNVIADAVEHHPNIPALELLRVRLDASDYSSTYTPLSWLYFPEIHKADLARFPEEMLPELRFHTAARWVLDDSPFYTDDLRPLFTGAKEAQDPPWRAQLLGLEAAYEYSCEGQDVTEVFHTVARLLHSALALQPHLAEPLSHDDVEALALVLEVAGDEATDPLCYQLMDARPLLRRARGESFTYRKPVFDALLSSLVPGIAVTAPIPGSSVAASQITRIIDTVGESRMGDDSAGTT